MPGPAAGETVAVLGAGAWGTALAVLLARGGHRVRLCGRDAGEMRAVEAAREHPRRLPEVPLPAGLTATAALEAALDEATLALIAVPSDAFAGMVTALGAANWRDRPVVWATKGFEPGTGRLLDAVVREGLGPRGPLAVLSGPTFATEVAAGLPAAVTLASPDPAVRRRLVGVFHQPCFRVYGTDDLIGVQIGGAVKNVLAIGAGIADGLGFGANTRAALVTRGLAELMRFGAALGGRSETLLGPAGLGDLVLTCTDDLSRNRRYGLALGRGASPAEAARAVGQLVEGAAASRVVAALAARHAVEMPISTEVDRVIHEGASPEAAVRRLLSRRAREEGGTNGARWQDP